MLSGLPWGGLIDGGGGVMVGWIDGWFMVSVGGWRVHGRVYSNIFTGSMTYKIIIERIIAFFYFIPFIQFRQYIKSLKQDCFQFLTYKRLSS